MKIYSIDYAIFNKPFHTCDFHTLFLSQ